MYRYRWEYENAPGLKKAPGRWSVDGRKNTYGSQRKWHLFHERMPIQVEAMSLATVRDFGFNEDDPAWPGLLMIMTTSFDAVVLRPWAPLPAGAFEGDLAAVVGTDAPYHVELVRPAGRTWLHVLGDAA